MKDINYTLRGVSVEQFATLFESTSDNITINVNIPVRTNYFDRSLAVGANIQFLESDRAFLVAEVFCHYLIEPECWKSLSENNTKNVVLPNAFVNNLARIAVSTSRGVIAAKTENTPFAKFFLPLIMIDQNEGDLVIAKPE